MSNETIRLQNLNIGYNNKSNVYIVAKDINAVIYSSELTCLIGSNGVGKSTLLRTMAAFQPKLDGDIFIKDRKIEDYTNKELAKNIGVVLTENPNLNNMTVFELVGLGRSPYTGFWGSLSNKDKDIVNDSIGMVGIENLKDRMIQTLSDGERQKVMLAKALAQQTPVIFLDEPTAFLDFPSKVEVMRLLHRLTRETNKTIFFSTHDIEMALQISDTVWLMDKKDGLNIGKPKELAANGSLSRHIERKGICFDKETFNIRITKE